MKIGNEPPTERTDVRNRGVFVTRFEKYEKFTYEQKTVYNKRRLNDNPFQTLRPTQIPFPIPEKGRPYRNMSFDGF